MIFLRVKQSFKREGTAADHALVALYGAQPTNLSALVEVDQINVIYLTLLATGAVAAVPG